MPSPKGCWIALVLSALVWAALGAAALALWAFTRWYVLLTLLWALSLAQH